MKLKLFRYADDFSILTPSQRMDQKGGDEIYLFQKTAQVLLITKRKAASATSNLRNVGTCICSDIPEGVKEYSWYGKEIVGITQT